MSDERGAVPRTACRGTKPVGDEPRWSPAARPAAPGTAPGRAPLPVRPAGRGGDRAPAGRRHAVPHLFYLTCPRAVAAVSRLERGGVMRDMQQRLATDAGHCAPRSRPPTVTTWPGAQAAAAAAGVEPLPPGTQSAGGMPDRVKCLHALVAHELAVPGANPLGREAADAGRAMVGGGPLRPVRLMTAARVAAIDCGTNSLRLLVADVDPAAAGSPTWTGGWRSSGWARAWTRPGGWPPRRWSARCGRCAATPGSSTTGRVGAVRMVATSATRDAANAGEFVRRRARHPRPRARGAQRG